MKHLSILGLVLAILVSGARASGSDGPKTFATWDIFEADKLASIWLIKRFIAPGAEILVFPKGETPPDAILFDMPGARFQRTYNRSTFERLAEHYNLHDKKISMLAKLIHDIEINTWERKRYRLTQKIENEVLTLIQTIPDPNALIQKGLHYFDALYGSVDVLE